MTPDLPNKIWLINCTIFLKFLLSCLHNLIPDTFAKLFLFSGARRRYHRLLSQVRIGEQRQKTGVQVNLLLTGELNLQEIMIGVLVMLQLDGTESEVLMKPNNETCIVLE